MDRTTIERRREERQRVKRKLRILLTITVLLLILFIIIVVASVRSGGLGALLQGDSNIVSNTIKNIGTSFTDDKATPTPTPGDLIVPTLSGNINDVTKSKRQNFIVFDNITSVYNITIKKDTYVAFRNTSGQPVGIVFSNGNDVKLKDGEENNVKFSKTGTITYEDSFDKTVNRIKGTITVEN